MKLHCNPPPVIFHLRFSMDAQLQADPTQKVTVNLHETEKSCLNMTLGSTLLVSLCNFIGTTTTASPKFLDRIQLNSKTSVFCRTTSPYIYTA